MYGSAHSHLEEGGNRIGGRFHHQQQCIFTRDERRTTSWMGMRTTSASMSRGGRGFQEWQASATPACTWEEQVSEMVSSVGYLALHLTNLTWSHSTSCLVGMARRRRCAVESVLCSCPTGWYGSWEEGLAQGSESSLILIAPLNTHTRLCIIYLFLMLLSHWRRCANVGESKSKYVYTIWWIIYRY